jgi:hypothetical protein
MFVTGISECLDFKKGMCKKNEEGCEKQGSGEGGGM